jgi:hypothetical protein
MSLVLFGGRVISGAVADERPVLKGTVNIVLGNAQGIVVLTDSKQTEIVNGQLSDKPTPPAQKLFRLDDQTVCTIAGFGSVPLPQFPEFVNSAAEIVDLYSAELQKHPGPHSFREKLTSLAFLVEFYLDGIENLQTLTPEQSASSYGFELILAGYDLDGNLKIDKLTVVSQVANGISHATYSFLPEKVVGRELIHETAGIGQYAVENILDHPQQLAGETGIGKYASSWATDHGSSLSTTEMEALASSLAHHAAIVNRVTNISGFRFIDLVGGRDQVAVLANKRIQKIDQSPFAPRRLKMEHFQIFTGFGINGEGVPGVALNGPAKETIGLYLKMDLTGGLVNLDRGYFYDDRFINDTLWYDGAVVGFESNEITDCELALGPDADRNPPFVKDLLTNPRYHWKRVLGR